MNRFFARFFVGALPIILASTAPTFAQTASIGAVCETSPTDCEAELLARIVTLKEAPSSGELDTEIAKLISSVFVAAAASTLAPNSAEARELQQGLAAAMRAAAAETTDSQIAKGFRQAAGAVNSGRASQEDPEGYGLPQPASPS